ncbi:MAG: hypothetical protein ABI488_06075 [Polyangiaceae bacterium]
MLEQLGEQLFEIALRPDARDYLERDQAQATAGIPAENNEPSCEL